MKCNAYKVDRKRIQAVSIRQVTSNKLIGFTFWLKQINSADDINSANGGLWKFTTDG